MPSRASPSASGSKKPRTSSHLGDQQTKYRSAAELEHERARDPLPRFRSQLRDAGVLDEATQAVIATEIRREVDDATEYAESQPGPTADSAPWHVYNEDRPGGTQPLAGLEGQALRRPWPSGRSSRQIRETLADVPGVPYNHVLEDRFMVNAEKILAGMRTMAAY